MMRFAISTFDRHQFVFRTLIQAGWQPVKLFSFPDDNVRDFNNEVVAIACRNKIDIQLSLIQPRDLEYLAQQGCEILMSTNRHAIVLSVQDGYVALLYWRVLPAMRQAVA